MSFFLSFGVSMVSSSFFFLNICVICHIGKKTEKKQCNSLTMTDCFKEM